MCRRSEAAQSPRQLATAAQELTGTSRNPGVSVQQSHWVQGNAVREKGTSRDRQKCQGRGVCKSARKSTRVENGARMERGVGLGREEAAGREPGGEGRDEPLREKQLPRGKCASSAIRSDSDNARRREGARGCPRHG